MRLLTAFLFSALCIPSVALAASMPEWDGTYLTGKHTVVMKTSEGDITLELDADAAPKTVTNFVTLVKTGYYDGLTFHRVIPNFIIQGGDPAGDGTGGASIYGDEFEDEINDIKLVRGVIAMANRGLDTNGSQFFIVQADATAWLDGRHTAFGKITKGLDVLEAISNVERNKNDMPLAPVTYTMDVVTNARVSLGKRSASSSSRSSVRSRVSSTKYETTAREKARGDVRAKRPSMPTCTPYWSGKIGACLPDGWRALDRKELRRMRGHKDAVAGIETDIPFIIQKAFVSVRFIAADNAEVISDNRIAGFESVDLVKMDIDGKEQTLSIFDATANNGTTLRYFVMNNGLPKSDTYFVVSVAVHTSVSSSDRAEIIAFFKSLTFENPTRK